MPLLADFLPLTALMLEQRFWFKKFFDFSPFMQKSGPLVMPGP
jgi:hypothetical protein